MTHADDPSGGSDAGDADEPDPGADTGRWQAFAESDEDLPLAAGGSSPKAFRLVTLLVGLVVFGGLVWLLLQ